MKTIYLSIVLVAASVFSTTLAQAQAEFGTGIMHIFNTVNDSRYAKDPAQCQSALYQFFSPDVYEYSGTLKYSGEPCTVKMPIDDEPIKLSIVAPTKEKQTRTIDLSKTQNTSTLCEVRDNKWMYWKFSSDGMTRIEPALRIDRVNETTVAVQILNQVSFFSDKTADACLVRTH